MLAKVKSAAIVGLEGRLVDVEVDISSGLPSFTKVATLPTLCQTRVIRLQDMVFRLSSRL